MAALVPAATVASIVMATTSPAVSAPRSQLAVASQAEPSSAEADAPVSPAGIGSETTTSCALDGPLLVTTIVYSIGNAIAVGI